MDGFNPSNNNRCNDNHLDKSCYGKDKCWSLKIIYLVAIIVWIVIVVCFSLYKLPFSYLLIIPPILFCFTISNGSYINIEVESEIGRIIYFPMLVILCINLYNWIAKDTSGNGEKMIHCIFIAMVSLLLSSVDIWTHKKWIFAIRHISSVFETYTISLIVYVIILYGFSRKYITQS